MASLSEQDRADVWAEFIRSLLSTGTLTKAQVRAAVDAADSWIDTNSSSYNTALPAAARSALSVKEKAALLMLVIARRYLVT